MKNSINEILTNLMQEHRIDDRTLSKYTGIATANISRLRINSDANPTTATLIPIARFFKVTIGQLIGEEPLVQKNILQNEDINNITNIINIPMIKWKDLYKYDKHYFEIFRITQWVATEREVNQATFAVQLELESFNDIIKKGAILIVDPAKSISHNGIAIFKHKKDISIKRIVKDEDMIYLKSIDTDIKSVRQISNEDIYIGSIVELRYAINDVL